MVGINHQTLCVGYGYLFPKTWCYIGTLKKISNGKLKCHKKN
jgi:hypothetical protein